VAEELRRQARQAGLDGLVRFTGPVENPLPYIQGFDIGACVSNDEGLPNSLLEAMACRKPVVSTPVGAIPELIQHGENGLLFPVGDVAALCEALELFLENPALRIRLGEAGRRTVEERFSLKEAAAEYAQAYRQLLER
jgi:glycosyltransferase involved in cell wall biosynthesis